MAIKHLTKMLGMTEVADNPFRSLQEVDTYLNTIKTKINEAESLLRQYETLFTKQAATAADIEFTINTDGPAQRDKKGAVIKLDKIDKIVVPKLDNLRKNFAVVDDLSDQVEQLDALYNSVSVNFRGVRGSNDMLKNIKAMQAQAEKKMNAALQFLNSVGEKYVPDPFRKMVEATLAIVSPNLEFKDHHTFIYGYETKDSNLAFSVYIQLRGLKDEEGNQYPHFFIVFSCVLKNSEERGKVDPLYYVTVMHDFTTPGKFMPGKQVANPGAAASALGLLLEMENVNTAIGVLPHGLDPNKISKNKFAEGSQVYKIHVDANSLTFELLKSVTKSQASEIATSIYKDVKGILAHIKKAQIKVKLYEEGGRWNVRYTLTNLAREDQVSINDLDFLAEHFDLDEEKLRRVVKVINGS